MRWFRRFRLFDTADWLFFALMCACSFVILVLAVGSLIHGNPFSIMCIVGFVVSNIMTIMGVNTATTYQMKKD